MDITKQKVIFLDVDGVLATVQSIQKYAKENGGTCPPGKAQLDPNCCAVLKDIVECLNAVVVISSTWRLNDHDLADLVRFLSYFTIPIVGVTQHITTGIASKCEIGRQIEIMEYCKARHIHPDNILIIDDSSEDLTMYHDRLLRTDPNIGLQRTDVQDAIAIANQKSHYHHPDELIDKKWWQFWK